MRRIASIILLSWAGVAGAQTVANTANVLHPIMKDPSQRKAISSVDRDPSLLGDSPSPATAPVRRNAVQAAPATSLAPAKPATLVARIAPNLSPSKITLLGTVAGIKGKMMVTNTGAESIVPLAQFAVLNEKGVQIGVASKSGPALPPNGAGLIEVVAPQAGAVDLKLLKLNPAPSGE